MEGNRKKRVKKEQNTTNQALFGGLLEFVYMQFLATLMKVPDAKKGH